jgi:tetratricopeptide (TPR) repeat protein
MRSASIPAKPLIITVVAMSLVATAAPLAQAPSHPVSRDWTRLRSENFFVEGTAAAKAMRDWLVKLETLRASLVAVFPKADLSSSVPNRVVVLDSAREFAAFLTPDARGRTPTNIGGYFLAADDANFFVVSAANMEPELIIYHEYAHFVLHKAISGPVPDWIHEGFAEFFSTFFIDRDRRLGVIGGVSSRLHHLRDGKLLPMSKFTERGAAEHFRAYDGGRFYAQAWALVHYFLLGQRGKRADQLLEYITATASGNSTEQAFTEAFRSTPDQLSLELYGYLRDNDRLPARGIPIAEVQLDPASTQPMFEWEVSLLRGRIQTLINRLDDADKALEIARGAMPQRPDVAFAVATLRRKQDRAAEAIALLRPLAEQSPDTFQTQAELGRALADANQHENALHSYERASSINSKDASFWIDVSLTLEAIGRSVDADAAMTRALAIDPDVSWYRTRSRRAWRLRLDAIAFQNALKYGDIVGLTEESGTYAGFLGVLAGRRGKLGAKVETLAEQIVAAVKPGSWQSSVIAFLQGRLTGSALVAKARGGGELTEAHAYVGLMALIEGRDAEARPHLDWVLGRGMRNYVEYGLVVDALRK